MNIQMVDLKGQYIKIKAEIDEAILNVIDQGNFINGPQVKEFASNLSQYNNVKHVIPCANGTDALQIAMMALDFKAGSEVIVPAFTYVATVEVIALLGLVPVFIDVLPGTFELDTEQLKDKLTSKTVAIVPVHLYGQCSNMEEILSFARQHSLKVIEDTAQAIGADYTFRNGAMQKAGTMGTIGTTSFFPSKNLGCYGDGGAIFTNDDHLASRIRMIANHGQSVKYVHDCVGINSRLDTLQAAILLIKLQNLDKYSAARNQVAERYDVSLKDIDGVRIPERAKFSTHVFHQYTLKIEQGSRDDLKQYLADKGIPSMIYYPISIHMQKAYEVYAYSEGDFPVSEGLCKKVISLPIHTEMQAEQQEQIIHHFKQYFRG